MMKSYLKVVDTFEQENGKVFKLLETVFNKAYGVKIEMSLPENLDGLNKALLKEIQVMIKTSKVSVAVTLNSALVLLYWQVSNRINQEILKENRAEYGKRMLQELSVILRKEHGQRFDRSNLSRMVVFTKAFPDKEIVATLSHKLSWSHFSVQFLGPLYLL